MVDLISALAAEGMWTPDSLPSGAKALPFVGCDVRAEARTLHLITSSWTGSKRRGNGSRIAPDWRNEEPAIND